MARLHLHNKNEEIRIVPKHFAGGGEGNLYRIQSPSKLAPHFIVKLYHPHKLSPERAHKLKYLIEHPPADFGVGQAPPSVVWVYDLVKDEKGKIIGFLMPLVRGDKLELLTSLRIPKKAASSWQRFAFGQAKADYYRLRFCFNIAVAIQQVHASEKYVLVDLKPDNIIAQPNGIIALVDMDSVEVVENGHSIFDAPVATPEYTPPEHYIKDQLSYDPTERQAWDRFSLAVIFYKLLLGIHPFAGGNKPPYDDCMTLEQKIEKGLFVHAPNSKEFMQVTPPPHQGFSKLDKNLQNLFIRAFVDGHHDPEARPSAEEWCVELLSSIDDPQLNSVFGHLSLPTTPEAIKVYRRLPSQILPLPEYKIENARVIIPKWHQELQTDLTAPLQLNSPSNSNYVRFRKKGNGAFALFVGIAVVAFYIGMFLDIPIFGFFGELIGEFFELMFEFEGFGVYIGLGLLAAVFIGINKIASYFNFLMSKEFKLKKKTEKSLETVKSRFESIKDKALKFKQGLDFSDQIPEVQELVDENQTVIDQFKHTQKETDQTVENLLLEEAAAYKKLHQEYLQKAQQDPMLQHLQADSLAGLKMMLLEEKVNSAAWEKAFDALRILLQDYKLAYKALKNQFNKVYQGILEEKKEKIGVLQKQLEQNQQQKAKVLEQRLSGKLPVNEVEKIKIEFDQNRIELERLHKEKERFAYINFKHFQKK